MGRPRGETKYVPIDNLLIIADTEKAVGVVRIQDIANSLNARAVTKVNEIDDKIKLMLHWLPKSQIREVNVQDASDVFPSLNATRTSKFSPKVIPYKTKLTCSMPDWIAKEKKFIASEEEGEGVATAPAPDKGGW